MEELKLCPFCGNKAEKETWTNYSMSEGQCKDMINCKSCNLRMSMEYCNYYEKSKMVDLIEKWNTRVDQ